MPFRDLHYSSRGHPDHLRMQTLSAPDMVPVCWPDVELVYGQWKGAIIAPLHYGHTLAWPIHASGIN